MTISATHFSFRRPECGHQRGFALLFAIVVLAVIAGLATIAIQIGRSQLNVARHASDRARGETAANAGIHFVIYGLIYRQTVRASSPGTRTSTPTPVFASDPRTWILDGRAFRWTYRGATVMLSIQAEDGRIDLNTAPRALLRAVFRGAGLTTHSAARLVDAVLDFRDPNSIRRLNGAEDEDYRAAGLPWGAKDAPFESVAELQRVLGMTPALYRRVAPALTVHSRQSGVNPLTAPKVVLGLIPGLSGDRARRIVELRARNRITEIAGLAAGQAFLTGISQNTFYVRADASTGGRALFTRIAIVEVARTPVGDVRIRAWRQSP